MGSSSSSEQRQESATVVDLSPQAIEAMHSLFDIDDLMLLVFSFLGPKHLMRLMPVNKKICSLVTDLDLWRPLLREAIVGKPADLVEEAIANPNQLLPHEQAATLRQLYRRFAWKLGLGNLDICHLGTQYWVSIQSEDSPFGQVAELRSVCWFHVRASRNLRPGRYRVRWRVSLRDHFHFEPLNFSAEATELGVRVSDVWNPNTEDGNNRAGQGPFFREIPSALEIPRSKLEHSKEETPVVFEITNFSGNWKWGLTVEYLEIVPLDSAGW